MANELVGWWEVGAVRRGRGSGLRRRRQLAKSRRVLQEAFPFLGLVRRSVRRLRLASRVSLLVASTTCLGKAEGLREWEQEDTLVPAGRLLAQRVLAARRK